MLQAIRDKTSGWIAYFIIGLISIPFALWGVNSYLGGGEVPPAAIVDGQEISLQELDSAYASYRRRLTQMFGGNIPEAFANEAIMKEQVLTQMIEEYSLRFYAEQNRYRIGDGRLNEIIRSMEAFQRDGQFDGEIYQSQIASLGYSPAGFEFELRRREAMQQLQAGISATAFSVPSVHKKLAELNNQTRTIRVVTKPLDSDGFEVSEEEILEYYEKNQSRFLTEEQIKIDYIELSLETLKSNLVVDEEKVRDRYDQTKELFTSTEIRTASHILISVASDAAETEAESAENEIQQIYKRIQSGDSFADLAREFSQDPVSAEEGGNLGEIERGMMVQPFEAALFNLEVDQVSEPIKTSFGWHLVKLHGISGGVAQTFDEVRSQIEEEIKTEIAENQIYDLVENLANIAYEQPDSLLPATEQLGLSLQTSGWFSRARGEGISSDSKVRNAAFSAEVLVQGLNSEAIELSDNRVVFIHLNDRMESQPKGMSEVREEIVATIKVNKSREANNQAGMQALDNLRAGGTLDAVAADWNIEVVQPEALSRTSKEIDAELVKLAFSMPAPEGSNSAFQGFSHADGAYSLVELIRIDTNESEVSDEQKSQLMTATASQEYQSVLKVIGSTADVVRTPADLLDY